MSKPRINVVEEGIESSVATLTAWLQELKRRSTKNITIKPNKNKWYSPKLKQLKSHIKLSKGAEKKTLRNTYVDELRKAKDEDNIKIRAKNKKKGVWGILNRPSQWEEITLRDTGGSLIKEEQVQVQMFATHFQDKIKNLQSPNDPVPVLKVLEEHMESVKEWDIQEVDELTVSKIIDGLPSKLSSGPDSISYRLLKTFKFELLTQMTDIANCSITTGNFPKTWKVSKVKPIWKGKGEKQSVDSYRPVSLTSCVGKIVEAVVNQQMTTAIEGQNIFPEEMHGFRQGRSTSTAISAVVEKVKSHLMDKKCVMLVALDASAAFDMMPRDFIIQSVKTIGGGPRICAWLKSYLNERTSYVQIKEARSELWETDTGVIQGGLLSPLLYNVGSITQPLWNKDSESEVYADDDIDIVVGDTAQECQRRGQAAAMKVGKWFQHVGLCLNTKKSEMMGFGFSPWPINVGGESIKPAESTKFLGCHIQGNLKWEKQVNLLNSKIRSCAGRIRYEGQFLDEKDRLTLYHGWIGGNIMANARAFLPLITDTQTQELQTACNAGIRAVAGLPRRGHHPVSETRKRLGIQSVSQTQDSILFQAAWRERPNPAKSPRTRQQFKGDVKLPVLSGWSGKMMKTKTLEAWNRLPTEIRSEKSELRMKKMVKEHVRQCAD